MKEPTGKHPNPARLGWMKREMRKPFRIMFWVLVVLMGFAAVGKLILSVGTGDTEHKVPIKRVVSDERRVRKPQSKRAVEKRRSSYWEERRERERQKRQKQRQEAERREQERKELEKRIKLDQYLTPKLEILPISGWERPGYLRLEHKPGDEYCYVRGKVKNTGNTTISYFEVAVSFEDAQGNVLDTDYTNSGETLKPGWSKEFEIMHHYRPEYKKLSVWVQNIR